MHHRTAQCSSEQAEAGLWTHTSRIFWALACLTLFGCSTSTTWHEDVTLPSGGQITIERTSFFVRKGERYLGFGLERDHTRISFRHPSLSALSIVWESEDYPIILDVSNDAIRLVAVGEGPSRDCKIYNNYRYVNGKWMTGNRFDDLNDLDANLAQTDSPPTRHIRAGDRQRLNGDPALPRFYKRYFIPEQPCFR